MFKNKGKFHDIIISLNITVILQVLSCISKCSVVKQKSPLDYINKLKLDWLMTNQAHGNGPTHHHCKQLCCDHLQIVCCCYKAQFVFVQELLQSCKIAM